MKLSIFNRAAEKKSEKNRIRREGGIPAVLYGVGKTAKPIFIKGEEFQAILRKLEKGLLATTVFELNDENHSLKAIIKDVQYHVVSYEIEHIDFLLLDDETPVTINVPIQITGAMDCEGVKMGGTLRQAIRSLKVKCLPKYIPQKFEVDVAAMKIAEAKRLSDIALPETVRPLARLEEVAIVIAKQAGS